MSGESDTTNNCSSGVRVTVGDGGTSAADLVVESPRSTETAVAPRGTFRFGATVHNQGEGRSNATTLRYYRSSDSRITTADTELGTDPISALAASGTDRQSIGQRAPASDGIYYYGACVDPVSGESDTTNNCSTGVRITVGDGRPDDEVGSSFDLNPFNDSPAGVAYGQGRFYVVDKSGIAYAYQASGRAEPSADVGLEDLTGSPEGVVFANGSLYVVDWIREDVLAYRADGRRDPSKDFNLDTDQFWPAGIAYADNRFYVVDYTTDKVYVYDGTGNRVRSADFELASANQFSEGITSANGMLYVVDDAHNRVYAYRTDGRREPASDFDLDAENSAPSGITYAGGKFFVVDDIDNRVYDYSDGGDGASAPDLVVQSPSVSDSSLTAGQSLTFRATVHNRGDGRSASTVLRYYRSSDSTITTSDTQVGTDSVGALAASGTSAESISLTAPSSAGTYYYGACVDSVSGESATNNNCSEAVRVTVTSGGGGGGDAVTGRLTTCSASRRGGTGFIDVTMRGTLQANRRVTNVFVTGYANGNLIGTDSTSSIAAGSSWSFRVSGSFYFPGSTTVICRAEWRYTVPSGGSRSGWTAAESPVLRDPDE